MAPQEELKEVRIHELFEVGVILKGANALAQLVLGALLLVFPNVADIVQALVANELVEDPSDFFATHLQGLATNLSSQTQLFAALYLLSHGLIKIVLVAGLLRDKLWAYPASLAVLTLFIVYQVIKFLENHSVTLALLTIFDLAVMWLIWHEYRRMPKAVV